MCEFIFNTYHYFETLYKMNQNLIKLSGSDAIRNLEESIPLNIEICDSIPRLIPYKYSNNKKALHITNRNGLMGHKNEIPFLEDDYTKILNNHYDLLDKVRKVRNKYEHTMHSIKFLSSSSSPLECFEIELKVEDKNITIFSNELVELIKDLNILFSKIADLIAIESFNNPDSYATTLCHEKLDRLDFKDINKIYNDNNLRIIGKVMYDF